MPASSACPPCAAIERIDVAVEHCHNPAREVAVEVSLQGVWAAGGGPGRPRCPATCSWAEWEGAQSRWLVGIDDLEAAALRGFAPVDRGSAQFLYAVGGDHEWAASPSCWTTLSSSAGLSGSSDSTQVYSPPAEPLMRMDSPSSRVPACRRERSCALSSAVCGDGHDGDVGHRST